MFKSLVPELGFNLNNTKVVAIGVLIKRGERYERGEEEGRKKRREGKERKRDRIIHFDLTHFHDFPSLIIVILKVKKTLQ